jgi:cytochrome c5
MRQPLTAALFALSLTACDQAPPPAPKAQSPADQATGERVFKQVCHACHGMGVAGAPRLGDRAQWEDRVGQGPEKLYQRALKGFTGSHGTMPPRGGKADLSDAEVRAGVDYMLSKLPPG